MRQHQYTSLAEIRQWAGLPWREPLYDSYLVHESFPLEVTAGERLEEWAPRLAVVQTEHPMRVVIWPVGGLFVWASYYARHFEPATIRRLMRAYERLVIALATRPAATLGELRRLATETFDEDPGAERNEEAEWRASAGRWSAAACWA